MMGNHLAAAYEAVDRLTIHVGDVHGVPQILVSGLPGVPLRGISGARDRIRALWPKLTPKQLEEVTARLSRRVDAEYRKRTRGGKR